MNESDPELPEKIIAECRRSDVGRRISKSREELLGDLADLIDHAVRRPSAYVGGPSREAALMLDAMLFGMLYSWCIFAGRKQDFRRSHRSDWEDDSGHTKSIDEAFYATHPEGDSEAWMDFITNHWREVMSTLGITPASNEE